MAEENNYAQPPELMRLPTEKSAHQSQAASWFTRAHPQQRACDWFSTCVYHATAQDHSAVQANRCPRRSNIGCCLVALTSQHAITDRRASACGQAEVCIQQCPCKQVSETVLPVLRKVQHLAWYQNEHYLTPFSDVFHGPLQWPGILFWGRPFTSDAISEVPRNS